MVWKIRYNKLGYITTSPIKLMDIQRDFKINNFDLLRLFAATEVVIDHYNRHLLLPINGFYSKVVALFPGVTIFFIISGYLISASYERNNNLGVYFKNRILRIFPGLWGCIALTIIALSLTGANFINKQTLLWLPLQLVGLIYTPSFLHGYGIGAYNGSLWTIPVELQFYMVLPVCYWIMSKLKNNWLWYLLLVIFCLLNVIYFNILLEPKLSKLLYYSFIPHFFIFLLGVLLQRLQIYKTSYIYNKGLYWLITYIIFSLTMPDFINGILFNIIQVTLTAITVISVGYTWPSVSTKLLRGNDISYGVYLYHGLVINLIVQLTWTAKVNLYEVLFATIVLATASWLVIEKPFIRRKEKALRKIEG